MEESYNHERKASPNRLEKIGSFDKTVDWSEFEKYFSTDLCAEKVDHLRIRFLTELVKILDNYLLSEHQRSSKVLDFHHPHALKEIMEHCLTIDKTPQNLEEILSDCRETLKYCVKTGHPRFLNQLSTGLDVVGIAGEMLTAVANTNMFTYEVAPVFTLVEETVIQKMLSYTGWSEGEGIFAPGGAISNLYAMLAARHKRFPNIKEDGVASAGPMVVFTSKQSHFSVQKSAVLLGMGKKSVIAVECDKKGKMDVNDLKRKMKAAQNNNQTPLMVNATCGTTILGMYDPVNKIADICEEYGAWLHVDGAWGGSALISEQHRHLLHGLHRANSMTWNPHKMMGVPLQCSAILIREKGLLMSANKTEATYLFHKDKHYDKDYDTGDMTIQCGRHNDVFKLWLMWRAKGDQGFQNQINNFFSLAKYLVSEIKKRPNFKLVQEEIEGPNVCFWYIPPEIKSIKDENERKEALHQVAPKLKALMMEKGSIMVTYQPLGELPNFFRIAISNTAMTKSDLDFVLDEFEKLSEDL